MKLYRNLLKALFWKAKDTKWIVLTASIIMMIISILFAVGDSVELSVFEASTNSSQYDLIISDLGYEVARNQLDELKEAGLISNGAVSSENIVLEIPDSNFVVNCIGLEGDYESIYGFVISEGDYPLKENEIVLEEKFKQISDVDYHIGDEVIFKVYSDETGSYQMIPFNISGFFNISTGGVYDLYGFVNTEGSIRILETLGRDSCGMLMLKAPKNTLESFEELLDNLSFCDTAQIHPNMNRYEMLLEMENGLSGAGWVFKLLGLFIGVVSIALLYNLFQVSTVSKIRQLGALRSVGMDRKQLGLSLFFNLCMYFVCSVALGFAFFLVAERAYGSLLLHAFTDSYLDGFKSVNIEWHFNISAFLTCAVLIVLIMGMVYLSILVRVMKLSPLQGMNYKETITNSKFNNAVQKKKKPIEYIGKRNLCRNRVRTLYTGFTIAVMSILFISVITIGLNVNLFDVNALRKGNLFDFEYYEDVNVATIDKDTLELIGSLPSVETVSPARRVVYELFFDEDAVIDSDFVVETRVYDDEIFGRILKENNLDVSIQGNPVYLLLGDYEQCESVTLYDADRVEHEIPITSVIKYENYCEHTMDSEHSLCIIMNEEAAEELFGSIRYNALMIKASDKNSCQSDVTKILNSLGITMYCNDLKGYMEVARRQLQSIVYIAIYVMACISVMVLANIICNININGDLRKSEYGILLAMGLNRKQIVNLMVYENLYMTRKALIISLPVSCCVSLFFISGLGQDINVLKLIFSMMAGSLLIYFITYAVCVIRGNLVFRQNIVGLIREG